MATRSISDFRATLVGSGGRPNLFRVVMQFPTIVPAGSANTNITFMAESASLPADKLGEIEVGFMGRKAYYPGDREFDPWTISIINDETFDIRDAFERWMSILNEHQANTRDVSAAGPNSYVTDVSVQQLSKIDGPAIKQYAIKGAFPTEVGAIELDWSTNNTIEKFQVTLRYQWWDSVGPTGPTTDGDAGPLNA
jgi:hypothetical protein